MTKLERIIVGHSFFPDGDAAVRSAAVLAHRAGAALYLLHIVEPYPLYQRMRFPSLPADAMLEEVVLNMRSQLNELAKRPEFAQLQVETDARVGKPFVELIRTCRDWNANLIAVGVSERGEGRFLGSTGERILRKSPVPVLLAKRELQVGPKTVLIPIDFSPCSKRAAEEGLALVKGFGGRALLLHVMDMAYVYPAAYGAEPIAIPPLTPEDLEPEWQQFLDGLPLDGVSFERHTREGRTAPMIAAAAEDYHADLVVIGTHGRTGLSHVLLGSVAESVLHLVQCSIMTVRPDAFRFELP
ncbi:MAG: universal stress protein [Candidatus Binatia bacterium]